MYVKIKVMQPKGPPLHLLHNHLARIYLNGVYSNFGPLVESLEVRLADYLKVDKKQVVLCSNATNAISAIAKLTNVSNYICPSFTFAATGLALAQSGKEFLFADIDSTTWELDSDAIKSHKNTGIVVVLPFGSQPNHQKFAKFENVIFDGAASIGNLDLRLDQLKESHSIIFSLHATKVLGIGEGGIAVFGNQKSATDFRKYINFGFSNERVSSLIGSNLKLSEYTAAVGHAVFDNIDSEFLEWKSSRNFVTEIEKEFDLQSYSQKSSSINPYWILKFRSSLERERMQFKLQEAGIETRKWWGSLHTWKIFKNINKINDLQNTNFIENTYLGLPFYRNMGKDEIEYIRKTLKTFN
jgi:dTDP-4-amino-4,6-dideoxygalactose transaminase